MTATGTLGPPETSRLVPSSGLAPSPSTGSGRVGRAAAHVAFAVVALGIATLHFVVLVRNGEPSGLDFGNWLTIGHHWLGDGAPGGSTSSYPPVVPLLSVAMVTTFGVSTGTALLASLAGLSPAVATYAVLSRGSVPRAVTVLLAAVVAAAGSTGEAVAWGGVPQLLGLGLGLLAVARYVQLLRSPTARTAWGCGLFLAATGATTHLVLAQVAFSLAVTTLVHLVLRLPGVRLAGPWWGRDGLLSHGARVALPMLPLAPLYLSLTGSVGGSFVARTTSGSRFAAMGTAFGNIFSDAPRLWKFGLLLALAAPLVLVRQRRQPLWLLCVGLLYADVASVWLTGETRLAYLAPLGIVVGTGLLAGQLPQILSRRGSVGASTVLSIALVLAIVAGVRQFPAQRHYYGERLVPVGATAAMDWLRRRTAPDALVAVAPVDALPFGWWVEGYGRRATLTAASEAYLNFPRERARARLSVALFSLTDSSAADFERQARRIGVDYLYLPADWNGLRGSSAERYLRAHPARVVYADPAATIVRVGSP